MMYTRLVEEYVKERSEWIATELSHYAIISSADLVLGSTSLFYKEELAAEEIGTWDVLGNAILRISDIWVTPEHYYTYLESKTYSKRTYRIKRR